jgi:hypothetical protein
MKENDAHHGSADWVVVALVWLFFGVGVCGTVTFLTPAVGYYVSVEEWPRRAVLGAVLGVLLGGVLGVLTWVWLPAEKPDHADEAEGHISH